MSSSRPANEVRDDVRGAMTCMGAEEARAPPPTRKLVSRDAPELNHHYLHAPRFFHATPPQFLPWPPLMATMPF